MLLQLQYYAYYAYSYYLEVEAHVKVEQNETT